MNTLLVLLCLSLISLSSCVGKNKYSKEANQGSRADGVQDNAENPFRMGKMNQIWSKAKKVLSAGKLEALRADLSTQDKQEITWKRLKVEGGDKDGLKEAQLRTQLLVILDRYGLGRYSPDDVTQASPVAGDVTTARMFKDKKLNRLWEKAEKAGFSQEELKALRQEFQHHQDRIAEYHQLLEEQQQSREVAEEISNHILGDEEVAPRDLKRNKSHQEYKSRINDLEAELGQNYARLQVAAVSGYGSGAFTEPRVAGLWKMANSADFTAEELDSLHAELKHYEVRLQKLRFHQSEMQVKDERHAPDQRPDKTEGRRVFDRRIEEKEREVQKLQAMLEDRILSRHTEL